MSTRIRILFYLLIAIPALFINSAAQDRDIENVKNKLPKMLGADNAGTEFWISIPPSYLETTSTECFIKIFVTSPYLTEVKVSVPGKSYEVQKTSIPNGVIEFNISPDIGQPYRHSPTDIPVPEQVFTGAGIHIESGDPVVVYCVVRYFANSDGFLAYPVSSVGREYIVASYGDMGGMYNGNYPSEVTIVSPYDNNEVSFTLGGNMVTRTSGGMKPGETKTEILNKGDVWMLSSYGYEADLTGSKITSSLPVGVVSGNFCTNVPTTNRWCDYTVEMDVPVYTWGMNVHVPKVPNRKYASLIRIFAKEPHTKIYRDGYEIARLTTGGGLLGKGWLEARMVPMGDAPRSVVISGDKPIGVTLYNTGIQEDGYPIPNSDPFAMSMTPTEQYQKEITFCTPGINGGLTFQENYINLVYETDNNGNLPYDFEMATVHNGVFEWERLRDKYPGNDEYFQYNFDTRKFAVKTIMLPGDGVYKFRAEKPFAAYSFGYGWCDSYGYPAAAATIEIGKVDIKPPDITYSIGSGTGTGSYISGSVWDLPQDETNRANLSMAVFHNNDSYNYEFKIDNFIPGEDKKNNWELNVIDRSKDAFAFVTFADKKGNDTTVFFEYKAMKLDAEDGFAGMPMKTGFTAEGSITVNGEGSEIPYYIGHAGHTEISLYNEAGNLLLKPVSGKFEKGVQSFYLDCSSLANGTYILIIINEGTRSSAMFKVLK